MLTRKVESRIKVEQIKQEPFFKDINWKLLEEKKINPPIILDQLLEEDLNAEDEIMVIE
jgi:hypothetical protein